MRWLCNTAEADTTFEPPVGNSRSGAPVIASMSGTAMRCNQGGTVRYIIYNVYPTPDFSGVVFLYLAAPFLRR